jgi:signal transduction histidine kinase
VYPELVEALPVAVALVTREGRVDFVNGRARTLLGAAGLGEDLVLEMALRVRRGADPDERARVTIASPTGERSFGFQASPVSDGAQLIAFQDITAIEQTQRERDRLLQLASISEVMPAVLHELKNPLAAIILMTELLLEDATPENRDRLHAVLGELRRLGLTLDGLGRFRHEVRSSRHAAIDLALREAFALLEPQAAARGIACTIDVKDMPLLPFEPAAVRAVLFNLVTNSIHACRQGDRIDVTADFDRPGATLRLLVSDTGPGMKPEVKAHCTELFFTTKAKGSGIGLALCAGVADAVGGSLAIDSREGEGTRITLEFPITPRRS